MRDYFPLRNFLWVKKSARWAFSWSAFSGTLWGWNRMTPYKIMLNEDEPELFVLAIKKAISMRLCPYLEGSAKREEIGGAFGCCDWLICFAGSSPLSVCIDVSQKRV